MASLCFFYVAVLFCSYFYSHTRHARIHRQNEYAVLGQLVVKTKTNVELLCRMWVGSIRTCTITFVVMVLNFNTKLIDYSKCLIFCTLKLM